ncbi:MAG: hypothetical protein KC535_03080 [Nanoarchaeota archaeon]|nr:hypothetical protein [Nanoarchaeota archaeon]
MNIYRIIGDIEQKSAKERLEVAVFMMNTWKEYQSTAQITLQTATVDSIAHYLSELHKIYERESLQYGIIAWALTELSEEVVQRAMEKEQTSIERLLR